MAGTVSGTVTYLERIAVPPDAVLEVKLLDMSRADMPSVTLASQRWALFGVPAPFALTYDDALIDDALSYTVQAAIYVGDERRYLSTSAYPVLTRGASAQAEIVVERIAGPAGPAGLAALENTAWRVTELRGMEVKSKQPPEIRFYEGGAFGALGGCNRFRGEAAISGDSLTFPDNMAGTLMACPPPLDDQEQRFLRALGEVTGYVRESRSLYLLNADGVAEMKLTLWQ